MNKNMVKALSMAGAQLRLEEELAGRPAQNCV
jgi:hypothetical protein